VSSEPFDELPATKRDADDEPPRLEPLELVVATGPDAGLKLELKSGSYLIGKSATCALVLTDEKVSRVHLELRLDDDGAHVRDLDSTNGSYYHGARFQQVTVGAGAVMRIGSTTLQLVTPRPPSRLAPSRSDHFGRLSGASLIMRELFALLEQVARTSSSVLIEGESGTGKELCAAAIHGASTRAEQRLAVCDLTTIPRTLIESELFGHAKGAFSGASADHAGLFESADGGTVFLDEIGELELEMQSRLLRVLEERKVRRIGEWHFRPLDVRVLAATNRDLDAEVRAGRFRADLYHRLAVVCVRIPPLRERREDIPMLVAELLAARNVRASAPLLSILQEHDWPGNVRELRNVIERGLAITPPGQPIEPAAIGIDIASGEGAESENYHAAKQRVIENWERQYVARFLDGAGGNVSKAARRCGLGRAYFYRLLRRYGIRD
jgi:DNA-binding NtrC family response regulator